MRPLSPPRLQLIPSLLLTAVLFLVFVATTFVTSDASACGMFAAPRRATEGELAAALPYLTVEQVLLVWDKETSTEDFIRETRFDKANSTFGFVVPTPTKPEVTAVKKPPFDALRAAFPFEPPQPPPSAPGSRGLGGLGGAGGGAGGAQPPPVVVLSEQRIGSFTAFTLSATDAGALDKWLTENGLETAPEAKPWTAHYVAMKFFFVAFRYEPKNAPPGLPGVDAGEAAPAMTSETVRIRFRTPHPYYPYLEPTHPKGASLPSSRMLTGWLVTREPMRPVAFKRTETGDHRSWQRPWHEGLQYTPTYEVLGKAAGFELQPILPKATVGSAKPDTTLVVQTFRDLKVSREGFGDAVLVPATKEWMNAQEMASRDLLLPVIDPTLVDPDPNTNANAKGDGGFVAGTEALVDAAPVARPPPIASATTGGEKGCNSSGAPGNWNAALLVPIALVVMRRTRRMYHALIGAMLVLLLAGCSRPKMSYTDAGDGGVIATVGSSPTPVTTAYDAPLPSPPSSGGGGRVGPLDPGIPPSKTPPAVVLTREQKEKVALQILAGDEPAGGIASDPESTRGGLSSIGLTTGPKADVQIGGATSSLPIADVDRVIAGLRPRFRQCYQTGLNVDPSQSGKLVISAKVQANGEVTSSDVSSSSGVSPAVGACAAGVVKRAQFSAPTGTAPATITIPLTLLPQKN